jgi:hypothetical protein
MGDVLSIRVFSSSSPYLLNSLIIDICFASCGFEVCPVAAAVIAEPAAPNIAALTPNFIASRREYLFFKGSASFFQEFTNHAISFAFGMEGNISVSNLAPLDNKQDPGQNTSSEPKSATAGAITRPRNLFSIAVASVPFQ